MTVYSDISRRWRMIACVVAVSMLCALGACSDDDRDDSGIPRESVYDYVTAERIGADGSVFTMRKSDDSELLTYTSRIDLSKTGKVKAGDRIIICYNRADGDTYTSGPIDLYAYILLAGTRTDVVRDDSAAVYMAMPRLPLHVSALWRSGTYINLNAGIYVTRAQRPPKFALVLDPTTVDSEIPDLYAVYANAEGNDGQNIYTVYASFDMSAIWDDPRYSGARVVYQTEKGPASVTFKKTDNPK